MSSRSAADKTHAPGHAVAELDDDALVAQAQRELPYRTGAFEVLMRRHAGRIRALTRRFAASAADAEDLAQEVMLKVFFDLPRFRGESAFSTWLWRIAAHECIDHQRRQRARVQTVGIDDDPRAVAQVELLADPRDAIAAVEARLDAEALLARLPTDDRLLVLLRLLLGLEFAEIAQITGLSVSATKMRFVRALQRLQRDA
jgi:RNA polymerase sigma-70 factor (ECF subfamily)